MLKRNTNPTDAHGQALSTIVSVYNNLKPE